MRKYYYRLFINNTPSNYLPTCNNDDDDNGTTASIINKIIKRILQLGRLVVRVVSSFVAVVVCGIFSIMKKRPSPIIANRLNNNKNNCLSSTMVARFFLSRCYVVVALTVGAVLLLIIDLVEDEQKPKATIGYDRPIIISRRHNPAEANYSSSELVLVDNATTVSLFDVITEDNATEMAAMFEARRLQVMAACKRNLGFQPPMPVFAFRSREPFKFIFLDEKHKILYCSVPKVASTNWRRFFVQLGAQNAQLKLDQVSAHNANATAPYLKPLSSFKEQYHFLSKRIKSYKKVIWVRDPLQRVLSAWRDKFQSKNEFYWKTHGSLILQRFDKHASASQIKEGGPVRLEPFLRYLIDFKTLTDIHWERYYRLCLPCHISYDYIGHLEGGVAEANYVIKQTTGQSDILFQGRSLDAEAYRQSRIQLATVPRSLLQTVIDRYSIDFDLFGYSKPNLNETLKI